MQLNDPIVTVYIPTYNRSALVKRAIESVLEQTEKNLEVIVVDDNSPDNTQEVVSEISRQYPNVRYIRNDENRGACYNRNVAIKHAKGKFVTGLDDDDYFLSHRIESFLEAWKTKHPDTIALFDDVTIKNSEQHSFELVRPDFMGLDELFVRNDIGNQIFIERQVFDNGLAYDEDLKSWQDIDLWIHILSVFKGKKFENIHKKSYIFDKSHPHERISSANISKHLISFQHIRDKYQLSNANSYRLKCQAYTYNPRSVGVTLFLDAFKSRSLYVVFRMIKYYLKNNKGM